MKRLNLTPESKAQAQKWGLFGALVLSLGFNLSWNPQLTQIARHEIKAGSMELASEDKIVVDLEQINSKKYKNLEMEVRQGPKADGKNKLLGRIVQKKSAITEGQVAETCKECTELRDLGITANFSDVSDVTAAVIFQKVKEQDELVSTTKVEIKESASIKASDKCADEEGQDLLDCKMETYESLVTSCDSKSGKEKKACNQELKVELKDSFSTIKKSYSACLKRSRTRISEDIDCEALAEFAIDTVIPNGPKDQVSDSSKFLKARADRELGALLADMDAKKVLPFEQNRILQSHLFKMGATPRQVFNAQTLRWEMQIDPIPRAGTWLGDIYDSYTANSNYGHDGDDATRAFVDSIYGPYRDLQLKTVTTPAGTGTGSALEYFKSTTSTSDLYTTTAAPVNLQQYRGPVPTSGIPVPPPMDRHDTGYAPQQPQQQYQQPQQQPLLSPSQRH
jgi:hypothetical protein